jgi:hypothetical protein
VFIKPAADAAALERIMQTVSEWFLCVTVADEARIKLNRLI